MNSTAGACRNNLAAIREATMSGEKDLADWAQKLGPAYGAIATFTAVGISIRTSGPAGTSVKDNGLVDRIKLRRAMTGRRFLLAGDERYRMMIDANSGQVLTQS
jgi:hypothetical protein